eukprot:tig00000293_g23882.t1
MPPAGRQRGVNGDKEELLDVICQRSDDPSFSDGASSQKNSKQERILSPIVEHLPEDDREPTWFVTIMYGAGCFLNELTAAMWFSYVLYALQLQGVSTGGAAAVLLAGQIADAVAIPIAGQLSDMTNHKLGKRRPWLAVGALVLSLAFIALFSPAPCVPIFPACKQDSVAIAWYVLWAVTFNCGWASVQVAHLALGTELSSKQTVQVRLNSVRFAFAVAARLTVFAIAAVFFQTIDGMSFGHFQLVAYVIVGLGVVAVALCVVFVKEPDFATAAATPRPGSATPTAAPGTPGSPGTPGEDGAPVPMSYWFGVRLFHEVAVIFTASRVVVVVVQSSMPFFVERTLHMEKTAVAMGPLSLQLACLFGSSLMPKLAQRLGVRGTFLAASLVCIAASACLKAVPAGPAAPSVYPLFVVLGFGTAGLMVCAMTFASTVVGPHSASGAFVFGSFGFLEKLATGLVIFVLQVAEVYHSAEGSAMAISVVPAVAGALAFLLVLQSPALRRGSAADAADASASSASETANGKPAPSSPRPLAAAAATRRSGEGDRSPQANGHHHPSVQVVPLYSGEPV